MTEDTIVQVRDRDRDRWVDYARTDRASALSAIEARKLPGHTTTEELRAIDWITHEEIAMTTTTAVPSEVVAELRTRREAGETLAELKKAFPGLSAATIKETVSQPGQVVGDYPKLEAAGIVSKPALDPGDASGADGANGSTDRKPRRAKARAPKAPAKSTKATAPKATGRKKAPATIAAPEGFSRGPIRSSLPPSSG